MIKLTDEELSARRSRLSTRLATMAMASSDRDVLKVLADRFEDISRSLRELSGANGSAAAPFNIDKSLQTDLEALAVSGEKLLEKLSTTRSASASSLEEAQNDGRFGLFATPETTEDGLQILEIREQVQEPPVSASTSSSSKPATKPVPPPSRPSKNAVVSELSKEDEAFLEHFRKWEEIEASEEVSRKTNKPNEKAKAPTPGRVSVTMHAGAQDGAPLKGHHAIRTPADIYGFMERTAKKGAGSSTAKPTNRPVTNKSKSVHFAEKDEFKIVPGRNAAAAGMPSKAGPFLKDTVVERDTEETPTEEDLDAYFDFKEAMEKYREMRPQILGDDHESSGSTANILEEVVLPGLPAEAIPREEEPEATGDVSPGRSQVESARVLPADGVVRSTIVERGESSASSGGAPVNGHAEDTTPASTEPAPTKKPSRFKASMNKEKSKPGS